MARLALSWAAEDPDRAEAWRMVDGTLGFFDISGFTRLTERLGRLGRVGAEVIGDAINGTFERLISPLLAAGGDVLKFGGDALLVLFTGEEHGVRAATAAASVQRLMAEHSRITTPVGPVRLRMSSALHTGRFLAVLTRTAHRELLLAGPDVGTVVALEASAAAGQVALGPALAAGLPPGWLVRGDGPARLRTTAAHRQAIMSQPSGARCAQGITAAQSLVPRSLRAILGGGPFGEHRPTAVAFVALCGTDATLAADGPEGVVTRIEHVAAVIDQASAVYGVCWLKCDVGSDQARFVLTAGAPVTSENDDERLLLAVRMIADRVDRVGIGVAEGRVYAGEFGHPARRAYDLMGEAPNLAARLMTRAGEGQVLVADEMLARLPGRFISVPVAPLLVKGIARHVSASTLGAPVPRLARDAVGHRLAGRDEELNRLRAALEATTAGRGCAVAVVGEAGIGKSRLVDELLTLAAGVRHAVLRGAPYETSNPYLPFRHGLRALFGTPDSPELAQRLARDARHLVPWGPLLGLVLGLDLASTAEVERLDPAFLRPQLHETVRAAIGALAPGPLLLVAEDLHWFDEASMNLIDDLASVAPERPWLVVVTSRPGGQVPDAADRLALHGLSSVTSRRLAVELSDDAALSDDELVRVVARAAGNPLFLRALLGGSISGARQLPETIERVIAARIDQLAGEHRRMLRDASVAGGTFSTALLSEVLGDPTVDDPARWVPLEGFLAVDVGGVARFHHDLMREVAYEGLPYARRRELHARFGDALARRVTPADHDQLAPLLAHHFAEGDRPDETWRWATVSAAVAERAAAGVEAAEVHRRALAAAGTLQLEPSAVASVARSLGDVSERLGRNDEALGAYARCRRLLDDDRIAVASVLCHEARVQERAGRYGAALRRLGRAAHVLDGLADDPRADAVRAEVALGRSVTRFFQGRLQDSLDLAQEAAATAERLGDRRTLAQAHLQMEMACSEGNRPERAAHGATALALFEELGDDLGLGNLLLNLGVSEYNESRWDRALECYRRSAEAYRRAGDVIGVASTLNNQAEILTDQGRYEEAQATLSDARRAYQAARYEMGIKLTTSARARLALRAGDDRLAEALLEEARSGFVALGAANLVLDTDVRLVEHRVFTCRAVDALDLAAAAKEALARFGDIAIVPITLERLRACALLQLGRIEEGSTVLAGALSMARADGVAAEVVWCLHAAAIFGAEGVGEPGRAHELSALRSQLGIVDVPDPPTAGWHSGRA